MRLSRGANGAERGEVEDGEKMKLMSILWMLKEGVQTATLEAFQEIGHSKRAEETRCEKMFVLCATWSQHKVRNG